MKQLVQKLTETKKDIFEKMNVNKQMDELTYEQKMNLEMPPTAPFVERKFKKTIQKSATTATSQVNTEARRM